MSKPVYENKLLENLHIAAGRLRAEHVSEVLFLHAAVNDWGLSLREKNN